MARDAKAASATFLLFGSDCTEHLEEERADWFPLISALSLITLVIIIEIRGWTSRRTKCLLAKCLLTKCLLTKCLFFQLDLEKETMLHADPIETMYDRVSIS